MNPIARDLRPVEALEVLVLVDNVTDALSTVPANAVNETATLLAGGMATMGGAAKCCAHHGLSLLLAVRSGPIERLLDFPYHPHVTIAHHLGEHALNRAFDELADFRCRFPVTSVELYHHDDDGVWRVIDSFPLRG